jgi:restriction system protein
MPIPPFQEFHIHVLKLCGDGAIHSPGDTAPIVADAMGISEEDREVMLPSGTQSTLQNRVNWAMYDLFRAGLLQRPKKGRYSITDTGRKLLQAPPAKIDREFLMRFPLFKEWTQKTNATMPSVESAIQATVVEDTITPEESIELSASQLTKKLITEILEMLALVNPYRFEQIVVDLLFAMGYGGSRKEAARVTKKSNDEGIDGVINEDRLGLDVIYVQAKRWKNIVGRKEVQSFVGALAGQKATKGVFITTSEFASSAVEYAKAVTQKVILIDGQRLAELMIEHNIGVSTTRTIELKRIDSDYYEES